MDDINRRDLLRNVTAFAVGGVLSGVGGNQSAAAAAQAAAAPDTLQFFPGFKRFTVQTSGALINGVVGGQGPPLLLLHGAPQSHISWRLVAPRLAATHTVVVADLRGYGDSSKVADTPDHSGYAKRAMALDQVEVMRHFGFERFPVAGHDRGGRVAHRMALDHPRTVTKIAVLDIVPTYYLYTHVNIQFVQSYFHWFNYLRPAPGPENELKQRFENPPARPLSAVQQEYRRVQSDPANIHAMCEDYRAGASIDLKHDEADLNKKIEVPLLVLWAEKAPMARIYDVLGTWRERGTKVSGKVLPGGHSLQEDVPDMVLAELQGWLKA